MLATTALKVLYGLIAWRIRVSSSGLYRWIPHYIVRGRVGSTFVESLNSLRGPRTIAIQCSISSRGGGPECPLSGREQSCAALTPFASMKDRIVTAQYGFSNTITIMRIHTKDEESHQSETTLASIFHGTLRVSSAMGGGEGNWEKNNAKNHKIFVLERWQPPLGFTRSTCSSSLDAVHSYRFIESNQIIIERQQKKNKIKIENRAQFECPDLNQPHLHLSGFCIFF